MGSEAAEHEMTEREFYDPTHDFQGQNVGRTGYLLF